jgi:hypothetical protein
VLSEHPAYLGMSALVGNQIVWVLAFAPLIGAALVLALLVLFRVKFAFATIALNIGLSWIDLDRLGSTSIDTSHLRGWMVFLVPVYLFRREQVTETRGYFVTWMVCLFPTSSLALLHPSQLLEFRHDSILKPTSSASVAGFCCRR